MKRCTCLVAAIAVSLFAGHVNAEWKMKQAPLMTKWAAEVDPKAPWPEYPRPQMVRKEWLNLNGIWEYQPGKEGDAPPIGKKLSSEILVPYPVESAISGVMEYHDRLWYRRSFKVSKDFRGDPELHDKRVLLHFGAVDYECEVFVNGKSVGTHKGGYDPFSFDISSALTPDGDQELIVRVFDPTNGGGQPRGKQSLRPGGIMYTPTSGIWQTVWLEPVPSIAIDRLKITPNIDDGTIIVDAELTAGESRLAPTITVTVKDGTKTVVTGRASTALKMLGAKLWSPDSPFLYDLEVSVQVGSRVTDTVTSYFGMRKSSLGEENGIKKTFLNNKFLWQIGPLDQGFWPDGLYTQPTEEALKFDIQTMKDLGFNMIRKHIKVEPARWYYWCDKIGLVVWQDMPSANSYDDHPTPPVDKEAYKRELTAMIENLRNEPCIIQWEIFNEGQGQHDTKELVEMVKKLDPTRLVNQASGGEHKGAGDIFDIHPYPAPQMPKPNAENQSMALAIGEFGGIGRMVKGHLWAGTNGGYMNIDTPQELIDTYATFTHLLKGFRDEHGLSAAVYTQITDVETELNGLLTYDRVPKMDIKEIAKANRFEIEGPTYTTIVSTSEKDSQTWKYTFDKPADGWRNKTFDDKAWKEGKGGFGTAGTPGIGELGTEWKTNDIWLRRTFKLDATNKQVSEMLARVYHDEDVQVFINGVKAFEAHGFDGRYANQPMKAEARRVLNPNGDNVMAVHCSQSVGGQYVDVGLSVRDEAKK